MSDQIDGRHPVPAKLPAAVLFDMDGLLVETEDLWYQAERVIMTEIGAEWGPEHQGALVGGPLEFAVAYMIEVSGQDHDHEVMLNRLMAEMEHVLRTEPVHWRPGAKQLVAALEECGVPMALVSASWRSLISAVHDSVLHELGHEVFVTTVAGDEVERTKPFPDPYLLAAERIGVDARHCVVLEDSHTGSQAGVASGALVVAVPSFVAIEPKDGLRVVSSLEELTPELLGEWSYQWAPRVGGDHG
jgi:HAD superfamily hydrolase (TIGR01509 family)